MSVATPDLIGLGSSRDKAPAPGTSKHSEGCERLDPSGSWTEFRAPPRLGHNLSAFPWIAHRTPPNPHMPWAPCGKLTCFEPAVLFVPGKFWGKYILAGSQPAPRQPATLPLRPFNSKPTSSARVTEIAAGPSGGPGPPHLSHRAPTWPGQVAPSLLRCGPAPGLMHRNRSGHHPPPPVRAGGCPLIQTSWNVTLSPRARG